MFDGITPGDWGQMAVGLAAMIVAIVYSKRQIDKRKIVCQIKVTPVIRIDGVASDDIEIRFKGTPVKTLSLYSISLLNSGNRPILKADWDEKLRFSFSTGAQVVDYRIGASKPRDLSLFFSSDNVGGAKEISFEPFLLNEKEGFRTEILVAGDAVPVISARVAGVSGIETLGMQGRNLALFLSIFTVIISSVWFVLDLNHLTVGSSFKISLQITALFGVLFTAAWISIYGPKFLAPLYIDENFVDRQG